jgi:hypothetical protein
VKLFRRKPKPTPEEQILLDHGWHQLGGGTGAVWTFSGSEWLSASDALDELAQRLAPDPPEQEPRWLS